MRGCLFVCLVSGCTFTPVNGTTPDPNRGRTLSTPAPKDTEKKPAAPTGPTSSLSLVVEPGDSGQAFIDALNNAQSSIHMTTYLLSSFDIEDALVARSQAGLDVRVVLNENGQPGASGPPDNAKGYSWLQGKGVDVVWAPAGFTYTHEKSAIIDGKTVWVMTMNSAKTSLTANREYLAIDTDAKDVAEADALFEADFAGTDFTPGDSRLLISPLTSRDKLGALLAGAKKTIDLEVEELSDSAFGQALCTAQMNGVTVRAIIADSMLTSAQNRTAKSLQDCGVQLVTLSTPYIHAKAMVVDGTSAYVGSVNFTAVSLDQNRELGLITADAAFIEALAAQIDADLQAGTPVVPN